MEGLVVLVVIGTSIWVLIDAQAIGVKNGQIKGMMDMGSWGWFFACLFLWIISFPCYLVRRSMYKKINSGNDATIQTHNNLTDSSEVPLKKQSSWDLEQLEKLANLKDRGIITEEEFQSKKKEFLGL